MRRILIALLLLTSVLMPLTAIRPAAATTRVSLNGLTVLLDVPVVLLGTTTSDLQARMRPDGKKKEDPADYFKDDAETFWNDGFATFSYRGCITFHLEFDVSTGIYDGANPETHNHVIVFNPDLQEPNLQFVDAGDPFDTNVQAGWGWSPFHAQVAMFLGLPGPVEVVTQDTIDLLGKIVAKQLGGLPGCIHARQVSSYTFDATVSGATRHIDATVALDVAPGPAKRAN